MPASAIQTSAEFFLRLAKKDPDQLRAFANFLEALALPESMQEAALPRAIDGLRDRIPVQDLLGLGLKENHAALVNACVPLLDLACLGTDGRSVVASPQESFYVHRKENEQGWVANRAFMVNPPSAELLTLARKASSPFVWCELLPKEGTMVTWLELFLGAGAWKAAEAIWQAGSFDAFQQGRREKPSFSELERSELAMAWLGGMEEVSKKDWNLYDFEAQDVFFLWWDRLLPNVKTLTTPVHCKKGWGLLKTVHGSRFYTTGESTQAEAVLQQDAKQKRLEQPPLMAGEHALRPLDLLLPLVGRVGNKHRLAAGVAHRLGRLDWSAVPVDGCFRPAAHALIGMVTNSKGVGSCIEPLWPVLLNGLSAEVQKVWWKHAVVRALFDQVPIEAAVPVFEGRHGFSDQGYLGKVFLILLTEPGDSRLGKEKLAQEKQDLLGHALERVFPAIEQTLVPGDRPTWKAFVNPIQKLAQQALVSPQKESEAWRALKMHLSLPLAHPAPARPRF